MLPAEIDERNDIKDSASLWIEETHRNKGGVSDEDQAFF
jgi:hypothetical protein